MSGLECVRGIAITALKVELEDVSSSIEDTLVRLRSYTKYMETLREKVISIEKRLESYID